MDTTRIDLHVDSSCPENLRPPVTTYNPSLWADTFSSYRVDDQLQEKYTEAIEMLKQEVKKMLVNDENSIVEKLTLIDTLERLGISYHFEKEIEDNLQLILQSHSDPVNGDAEYDDLFTVSLEFRLLRQHQYHVTCGVFNRFKDNNNKFNEDISCNVEALLSLYEAAQVRIHGEEILDEAVTFTTHHLNLMLPKLMSPLQDKVKRALKQSLHRGVPIIEARNYISMYEKDVNKNELLLKFSKINFNYLQNLYKGELYDLSRWWNKFDLKTKLPYARDRWVECYLWGVALHFEPKYSFVRSAAAKSMQLISTVNDTYDNYATIEEAQIFTDILEKWDADEVDPLPDYMKIVYKFVLSTYEDFEREAVKEQRSFTIPYAREAVKQVGRAYLKDLKWFMGRKMPDFEEYFANTVFTSAIYLICTACFVGMESVSKDSIDWFVDGPQIVLATAKMGRYVEDLCSYEREHKEGQMLTAVDCYMKQHGLSKEQTLAKFIEQGDEGWKDVNTERLNVTDAARKDILYMLLGYTRAAEITYKNGEDGYTYPEKVLATPIAALFINPLILEF